MKKQLLTAIGIGAGILISQTMRASLKGERVSAEKPQVANNIASGMDQKTKNSFARWGDKECVENMLRKTNSDPRFVRARDEIGTAYPAFVENVMRPSMQLYCECSAASIISGDSMSQSMQTCQPIMEREIRTRMDAFIEGYR